MSNRSPATLVYLQDKMLNLTLAILYALPHGTGGRINTHTGLVPRCMWIASFSHCHVYTWFLKYVKNVTDRFIINDVSLFVINASRPSPWLNITLIVHCLHDRHHHHHQQMPSGQRTNIHYQPSLRAHVKLHSSDLILWQFIPKVSIPKINMQVYGFLT